MEEGSVAVHSLYAQGQLRTVLQEGTPHDREA